MVQQTDVVLDQSVDGGGGGAQPKTEAQLAYEKCLSEISPTAPRYLREVDRDVCGMREKFDEAVDSKLANLSELQRQGVKDVGAALLSRDPAAAMRQVMQRYSGNPTDFRAIAKGLDAVLSSEIGIRVEYDTNRDNPFETALHFNQKSVGVLKLKWNDGGKMNGQWEFDTEGHVADHEWHNGSRINTQAAPEAILVRLHKRFGNA